MMMSWVLEDLLSDNISGKRRRASKSFSYYERLAGQAPYRLQEAR